MIPKHATRIYGVSPPLCQHLLRQERAFLPKGKASGSDFTVFQRNSHCQKAVFLRVVKTGAALLCKQKYPACFITSIKDLPKGFTDWESIRVYIEDYITVFQSVKSGLDDKSLPTAVPETKLRISVIQKAAVINEACSQKPFIVEDPNIIRAQSRSPLDGDFNPLIVSLAAECHKDFAHSTRRSPTSL